MRISIHSLRSLTVATVLSLALPQTGARAAAGDVLPFQATERTLANGLKVIAVPTGFPNLVSIQIPVQTGSRNEVERGKSGFAHFFEHVMFRGTPETPPEKYREVMGKAGARDNASTGDDYTQYYSTFAKEHLERIMALYADMFQNLAYAEADFKTEARAILGEYNKNSADPIRKLLEVQRDQYFQAHTYKHTTMGFIADIEDMPNQYEYSKVFFQRWYRPQFTTLVVAGDIDPGQVLALAEKYWGGWKPGAAVPTDIPKEPAPRGPLYAHVPWTGDALPYVTVAFPSPAFSESSKDSPAIELLAALYFGPTSDLYTKLVVNEQKVDALDVDVPANVDASLFTVFARVKNPADTVYVRDQILATIASARATPVPAQRLADAKSYSRYSFARTLDSTERIASVISAYASYQRSFDTVNSYYRTLDSLTADDLQNVSRRYFTDAGMIVTTLSKDALPAAIKTAPALASVKPAPAFSAPSTATSAPAATLKPSADPGPAIRLVQQRSVLPQLNFKLLFTVGSAHDPAGKEGLAALTAAMITEAGSRTMTIEQIEAVLYPMAGSFSAQPDKEMTTLTGIIHRDHWSRFLGTVLPQLVEPGFREEDFKRLKDAQLNALVQDLRSNNEEELGKERLQTNVFRGTPYGHVALGTVAGIKAITLDDVKRFAGEMYTRANLTVGINGDAPEEMLQTLRSALASLPQGTERPRVTIQAKRPAGREVEIIEKDTRATAVSFGFPIELTRTHPDFPALSVARVFLGEHRLGSGQLYQRIREVRGINYGDYAYIEAFPRGMFQFFPDANVARQRQLFEIWIRPVVPANAHMTLRIAVHELTKLVEKGLTAEQFEATRGYLMNNVYVMTARQDHQLGYALDSQWYGIGEFTEHMRKALSSLTVDQVNAAIRKHLNPRDMAMVIITKDAAALKRALVSDAFSPIKYDGEKPADLLAEDKMIGGLKLGISADKVKVTPVAEVFAR